MKLLETFPHCYIACTETHPKHSARYIDGTPPVYTSGIGLLRQAARRSAPPGHLRLWIRVATIVETVTNDGQVWKSGMPAGGVA